MHPLGGRELYRVAWLILGLASGCLLSPRYVLPSPTTFRFFPIASSLLSYYSHSTLPYRLTTYLESRAQHTSRRFPIIFIFYLFLSIVKQNLDLSWKKKKKEKLSFSFPLAFEREFYSDFPLLSHAIHGFPTPYLVLVHFFFTFPFSRENHPSTFWHGAHPTTSSCVAADS